MSVNDRDRADGDRVTDYSLHGLITIRLVNAPRKALAELEYLLGPSQGIPAAEPDVRIVYTSRLWPRNRLRYIGLREAAYDDESFYLVSQKGRLARFDFAQLGERTEFVCEPGASIFPYLLPVLSLRLLNKGYVMLHAAALVHAGAGILKTGWQKGGKTELLLSFMAAGARYVADEWTIVSPTERKMWGVSGTLQIWDWHLRYLPGYWQRLRPAERRRLRLLRLYQRLYRLVPAAWQGRGLAGEWLHRLSLDGGNALWGQARSSPARLFGAQVWSGAVPIDLIFLAGVAPAISVAPVAPDEIARRMVASLAFERRSLVALYQKFKYAFPGRQNAFLEGAEGTELRYLAQTLRSLPAYELMHPYPVALPDLYKACLPVVSEIGRTYPERVAP